MGIIDLFPSAVHYPRIIMIALTFNVIIPPADLSGVFSLHWIHYEKQSRSPGLVLPRDLGGPAVASSLAVLACVDCKVPLLP